MSDNATMNELFRRRKTATGNSASSAITTAVRRSQFVGKLIPTDISHGVIKATPVTSE
jgi:hypothetical protein